MVTVVPRKITAVSVNGVRCDDNGNVALPTDSTPTNNSTNYVTSGGVKAELDALSQRIGNAENPAQVWVDVPFTIPVNSWTSGANGYTAVVESSSILATSGVFVNYDSLDNAVTPITAKESTGEVTFTTETIPTGVISGTFRIIDSVNGIVPTERGGTGVAATSNDNLLTQLGAAKQSDMTTAQTDIQNLTALVGNIDSPAQTALEVPFSIATSGWSGSGPYTATINSSSIITNSIVLQPNITSGFDDLDITWSWQRNSNNSITFTVDNKPSNTVAGTIPVVLSINGIVPLARGGTGIAASTNAELLAGLGAASTSALNTGLAGKQNTLTFDSTPTSGSTNPVTSGGVYAKIGAVENTPLQTQVSALNTEMGEKAYAIFLQSSDNTWSKAYGKISNLTTSKPALILCNNTAMGVLSNGARTSAVTHGIITKMSNTVYNFVLITTTRHMFLATLTVSNGEFSSWIEQEIIDASSYALVSAGDAHSAIASGEFVFVHNHGTLSDGLYTAKSNIASGATLSTSNLTAVSGGGLNALNSQITNLDSAPSNLTAANGITIQHVAKSRVGHIVAYNLVVTTTALSNGDVVLTGFEERTTSFNGVPTIVATDNAGNIAHFIITDTNSLCAVSSIMAGNWRMAFSFITK